MSYFSFKKHRAYLDWASAAPVHPDALEAFNLAIRTYGNPSSPHQEGVQAKESLQASRTQIARLAGVKTEAVIFTSGATEANALAVGGRARRLLDSGMEYAQMHILYMPTMHASVVATIRALSSKGVRTEAIAIKDGAVDLQAFSKQLRPSTVLVCVDAICGETGMRFDTLRMRRAIDAAGYASTALLHVDASQLPVVEPIEHTRLGADLMTLDAQKVGAIRGIGALLVPHRDAINPITYGGGQEYGLRPGTEPVALAASFAAALGVRAAGNVTFSKYAQSTRRQLLQSIKATIPSMSVIDGKRMAPHILNMQFSGIDTDYLVMLLDARGFAAATRSACETNSEHGSHAVQILTGDTSRAISTLRVSWGPETDQKDIERFTKALISSLRFLAESAI